MNKISIFKHIKYILRPSLFREGLGVSLVLLLLLACSSDEDYDPYHDWQERNDAWFASVATQARSAIQDARQQYGDGWEQHTEWRMYKSLMRSDTYQSGVTTDSICVRILKPGTGTTYPKSTDGVEVAFQGFLMPTTDEYGHHMEVMFTSTYQGEYNPATANFNTAAVSAYKDGFYTALQYMVAGASWEVYIPYQLFYGETEQDAIPAYSCARFLIHRR